MQQGKGSTNSTEKKSNLSRHVENQRSIKSGTQPNHNVELLDGLANVGSILRRMELQMEDTQQEAEINWQWNAIATVVEKIFLCVSITLLIVLSFAIILPAASRPSKF